MVKQTAAIFKTGLKSEYRIRLRWHPGVSGVLSQKDYSGFMKEKLIILLLGVNRRLYFFDATHAKIALCGSILS